MRIAAIGLVTAFLLSPPVIADDSATVLSGEVAVDTMSTGEVVVALDEEPVDGIADHEFVLQREEPFEAVSAHLAAARVVVRDDQISISGAEVALLLLVEGTKPRLRGRRDRWQIVTGFGLSRSWGVDGLGLPVEIVASESHFRGEGGSLKGVIQEDPVPGPGSFCDSGGPGSTQCSVGGCQGAPSACSVTCSAPRYACCLCLFGASQFARCTCESTTPRE